MDKKLVWWETIILMGKPPGEWMRWDDNIKVLVTGINCVDGSWKELGQDCVQWNFYVLVLLNLPEIVCKRRSSLSDFISVIIFRISRVPSVI
jgi:hypothetical protein